MLLHNTKSTDAVVASTGYIGREVYELRKLNGQTHDKDFLMTGSMGHALAISQGIAVAQPDRNVVCIDGDGACLMHMGTLALSPSMQLENLHHVLINNECHESVGGQPTPASSLDFSFVSVAKGCGYSKAVSVSTGAALQRAIDSMWKQPGPSFIEIRVAEGARQDLGRP